MNDNDFKNPLKEIEEQMDRMLFPNKNKSKKENNNNTSSLQGLKKQLKALVNELKQKHLNLVA